MSITQILTELKKTEGLNNINNLKKKQLGVLRKDQPKLKNKLKRLKQIFRFFFLKQINFII